MLLFVPNLIALVIVVYYFTFRLAYPLFSSAVIFANQVQVVVRGIWAPDISVAASGSNPMTAKISFLWSGVGGAYAIIR